MSRKVKDCIVLLLVVCFCGCSGIPSLSASPSWKVTIKVVDQDAVPVEDAEVRVAWWIPSRTAPQQDRVIGLSDEDGLFTTDGESSGRLTFVVEKNGYYTSRINKFDFETTRLRRWMPWNPTVEIELKEIRNPVPMYANYFLSNIPKEETDIGFDLEKGDWVEPYGKGSISDLIFYLTRRGERWEDFEIRLEISFSNEGDGIQEVRVPDPPVSALRLDHLAPETGYHERYVRERYQTPERGREVGEDQERNFIFRVRSQIDASGNVIEAKYGKIHGDFHISGSPLPRVGVGFLYYFNPDGTRNLEMNVADNLVPEKYRDHRRARLITP